MILAALLLAAACTPVRTCCPTCTPKITTNCATPTPVIRADHDRKNTHHYRVEAQIAGDAVWPWKADIPYVPASPPNIDLAHGESAPIILLPWPAQRIVPTWIQKQGVRFRVLAVSPLGVESALSPMVTICMPPIWAKGGPPWN